MNTWRAMWNSDAYRQYSMGFHTAKVCCPKARKSPGSPQNILMEKTEERLQKRRHS